MEEGGKTASYDQDTTKQFTPCLPSTLYYISRSLHNRITTPIPPYQSPYCIWLGYRLDEEGGLYKRGGKGKVEDEFESLVFAFSFLDVLLRG